MPDALERPLDEESPEGAVSEPHSKLIGEPIRSQALPGRLLDREPDPELQCIVEAAVSGTGFPSATINLGARNALVFRAHVGLPAELEATGSMELRSSYCRLVIESGGPVFIGDAAAQPDLPQELVERFGLRAYAGVPLRLQDRVVGALCVLDSKPRDASTDPTEKLERLASLAARRLAELSGRAPAPSGLISQAAEPAFAEIRNLLSSVVANAAYGRIVVGELEPMIDLLGRVAKGRLSESDLERVEEALPHSIEAQRELSFAFTELELVAKKLVETVSGLEKTVASRTSYEHTIGDAVEAATLAAHHFTKLVGGVRWEALPGSIERRPAPPWTGLTVSIALQELAARLGGGAQEGIDARVEDHGASISIVFRAPSMTEAQHGDLVRELGFLLSSVSSIEVHAEGQGIRLRL
jgi:hypothetical protein